MEGPTPVSALIHAATMVTAGMFLIIRCSPLFEYAPGVLTIMVFVGATTAFFSAGAVIHGLSNEQDIRKMGGLGKIMLFTYTMFLIGSLALIGFPFLSGFYSKDLILDITDFAVSYPLIGVSTKEQKMLLLNKIKTVWIKKSFLAFLKKILGKTASNTKSIFIIAYLKEVSCWLGKPGQFSSVFSFLNK
jgi:formate hydrogenlyase subunit 3/multisubunit Na+/H+ antiporter MnhD subunit